MKCAHICAWCKHPPPHEKNEGGEPEMGKSKGGRRKAGTKEEDVEKWVGDGMKEEGKERVERKDGREKDDHSG